MKNILKVMALALVVAMVATSCDCYKKMAKNPDAVQVVCTPEVLVLNNGKVVADVTVSVPADYFHKDAAVKVTPALFYKGGVTKGESFILQGEKVAMNGMVVKAGEALNVSRHIEFDYTDAMEACELKMLVEVKCKSGKCKEFSLVNANNGAVLSSNQLAILQRGDAMALALESECGRKIATGVNTLQRTLDYADAMQAEANNYKNVTTTVVKADIVYKINSSKVAKQSMKSEALAHLKSTVQGNLSNERAQQSIYVNGYASPDGPERFNDKLSDKRSKSGVTAIEGLLQDSGLTIDAAAYGEDWEGFKEAVAASSIEDKDLILQVLNMYSSSAEREKEIKNISSVFSDIKDKVLPTLRRAQVVNTTDVSGRTDAEMLALVEKGRAADLSVEELLHIAEVAPEVAEPALRAACSKSNDTRAYNNLAVVLAKQGDYDGALAALESAAMAGSKSEELSNNYALVYLAKGDVAKAEEYARSASDETKALVAASKGDYATASKSLTGYNAAVAAVQDGNLAAAKRNLSGDESAKADYLRAVIAAKEGNVSEAKSHLNKATSKDASLAKRAAKDVNLAALR